MSKNISLLYVLRAIQFSFVTIPTLVLFFEDNGLTLKDILILKAILSAIVLFLELPSGYLADLLGRKNILLCGMYSWTLSSLTYCFADTFEGFLLAEVFFGIALSLISGADTALLYDTLKAENKIETYPMHEGKLGSIMGYSEAIGGLTGAFIASFHLRAPFFLSLILHLAGTICTHLLIEPERTEKLEQFHPFKTLLLVAQNAFFHSKKLRWLLLFGSLSGTSTFLIVWYSQKYMSNIGLPVAGFGVAWAIFHIVLGTTSLFARKLIATAGAYRVLFYVSLLTAVSYITLGMFEHLAGLIFIAVLYATRGIRTPTLRIFINSLASSDTRATLFSLYSLLFRIQWVIYAPFIGWITDTYSLSTAFQLSGIIFGSLCLLTLFMMKKNESLSCGH